MVFPIIVLPISALLLRFGTLMSDTTIKGITEKSGVWYVGKIMSSMGQPAFTYLPLVFAIGLSFGLSKDSRGEAALAGALACLVLQSLLTEYSLPSLFYDRVMVYHKGKNNDTLSVLNGYSELLYIVKSNQVTWGLDIGVLGGIVSGSITAWLYNHYSTIKLPQAFAFFEGRRFVCVISIIVMLPIGIFFAALWPWVQIGLVKLGLELINLGYFGTFIHTLLKSLLVLFGLHQILNTFLWFQLPITGEALFNNGDYIAGNTYTVNGDITAFLAGINGSGLFQIGSFPEIMGGYWGVTFAIIMNAKKERTKEVMGLMLPICFVCSLTGVGEPLILPIWYASPLIYFIQSTLNAIFGTIPAAMGIRSGFGFSAGWVDYLISFYTSWKMATLSNNRFWANPLWLIPIAIITALCYFVTFYYLIKFRDIKTVGRDSELIINNNKKDFIEEKEKKIAIRIAELIGLNNIIDISNCATRLRLVLKDNSNIDEKKLKK